MQLEKPIEAAPHPEPVPPAPHEEEPDAAPGPGHGLMSLPLHVNARGMALGVIATVAFLFALQWARNFLVPFLLGVFLAYTLNPVVLWLGRLHIRRTAAATIVTAAMLVVLAGIVYRVQGQVFDIIDELPRITQKVGKLLSQPGGGKGTIAQVQAAAVELEQATVGTTAASRQSKRSAAPPPAASGFRVFDWVLAGSMRMAGFLTEATMVVFLVFFLLLAGDTFKRKLVKLTGPSLSQKRITVQILDDITTSIQNYLFMLLVTNSLLALLMWLALRAIGLENAGAWAVLAGVTHIMPYFGPILITAATGLVAFMQFESLREVLLVAGASLAIATLVGTVVTTWMTGKIAKMNAAAVFVSLLFWGWLWGVWGLFLGVPVIVVLKVVAERVEGMEVIAELLSE